MAFAAKLASPRIGGAQIAFVRFGLGALPVLLVPRWRRSATTVQRLDLLLYRGVAGGVAVLLFFLAIEHIPVGMASLLNCVSPVFAVAFAALFVGEHADRRLAVPAVVTLVGVAMVVQGRVGVGAWGFGPWEVAGLASAVCAGAAVAAIRAARRSESSWSIYASFTLFGLVVTAPLALSRWVDPTGLELVWLVTVGATALAAQLLMTWAYRWVDNLRAGVISQIAVLVASALGVAVLGDRFSAAQLLGGALTVGGVLGVVALGAPPVPTPGGDRRGPAS
jgi:drug/metabolite transporter (DMT)-like permease